MYYTWLITFRFCDQQNPETPGLRQIGSFTFIDYFKKNLYI